MFTGFEDPESDVIRSFMFADFGDPDPDVFDGFLEGTTAVSTFAFNGITDLDEPAMEVDDALVDDLRRKMPSGDNVAFRPLEDDLEDGVSYRSWEDDVTGSLRDL